MKLFLIFVIPILLSLQPSRPQCNCRMEVTYYRNGKLVKRVRNVFFSSIWNNPEHSERYIIEGKIYVVDSITYKVPH